jgi:hypothetical protein
LHERCVSARDEASIQISNARIAFLISSFHLGERQVLINLQALLAGVPTDELDLCVRQPLCRQPGEHLVPEQMGMDALWQAHLRCVPGHDLLDTVGGDVPSLPPVPDPNSCPNGK